MRGYITRGCKKCRYIHRCSCNGNVSCGKCKVKLLNGKVDTEKTRHITDDEWEQGYILACCTKVISDIEIEVPSKVSSSMHGMKIEGSNKRG